MFHLHRSSDNQFYFTLRARNGETTLPSEMYTTKAMAKKGIKSIIKDVVRIHKLNLQPVDHTMKLKKPKTVVPSLNLTTERLVNGKLKPVRVTAGKKKGK
jgi:uncharacterized protein YegP (UPF0339 family)